MKSKMPERNRERPRCHDIHIVLSTTVVCKEESEESSRMGEVFFSSSDFNQSEQRGSDVGFVWAYLC